jgi:hypothetical protein
LAASNSSRIRRGQNRHQRPQYRPKRFAKIPSWKIVQT